MINKTKKNNKSLFDILDNRKNSFQEINRLTYYQLETLYHQIGEALLMKDIEIKTKDGIHPHFGKIS